MSQRTEPRLPRVSTPPPGEGSGTGRAIIACVLLFAVVYATFLAAVALGWVSVGS